MQLRFPRMNNHDKWNITELLDSLCDRFEVRFLKFLFFFWRKTHNSDIKILKALGYGFYTVLLFQR
jgi:hypothetical protein